MQNKIVVLSLLLLLGACSTWLGEEKRVNVDGERISVLVYDKSIKPEEDVKIKLPRPEANNDWPQAGGYAHHSMQHLLISKYPREAWSKSFGKGSDSRNYLLIEPIVANDTVYVMDVRSIVSAYRLKDGKRLWGRNLTRITSYNVCYTKLSRNPDSPKRITYYNQSFPEKNDKKTLPDEKINKAKFAHS